MRALSPLNRDKSALSNIVAYVLLISITIALSVMVYGWLRFYVQPDDTVDCPGGVNLIIRSYECIKPNDAGEGGRITVILKNKGLFTVDGYELRVHNRPDAKSGFFSFDDSGFPIIPGNETVATYNFVDYLVDNGRQLNDVTFLEVQPYVNDVGGKIRCKAYAFQEIDCSEGS